MPTQITEWSAAMMTSLAAAMAMLFSAIPKVLGFAIIVVVGWLLSALVEKAIAAVLRAIRFNDLAGRSGLADFVGKMGTGTDSAGMIAMVAKWFIRLIALVVAFDALGLPAVSDVLRALLLWLPNVVVALVVLVIGGLAARALSNLVRAATAEAGLTNANLLAKVASVLVWAFAVVVAVNQIGIATTLVNTLFMAFVGAIALGLGLAFGLGGRETAGEILRNWYGKAQRQSGQLQHAAEAGGRMASSGAAGMGSTDTGAASFAGSSTGAAPFEGGRSSDPYASGGATGGGYSSGDYGSGGYGGGAGGPAAASQFPTGGGMAGARPGTPGGTATGGGGGAAAPRDDNSQMYPTPSAPRHPFEGGI
ncbi:MAG TPA: small-conductance mechanosensitive ion channel [Ramlibacter sp.]|jgi:hypothetical protein|uniref:mechanosensitive ion channel family protein n=1 Tax=Ramlibacter sp. TaxID=1917967 RepID=UPI002D51EB04|nr:small-conductance mechanosensitive ion channel [Ramlibacter sp.]HZY19524.1 small-conductance mechanosensitive ion channel [Ramlibacter sp.]